MKKTIYLDGAAAMPVAEEVVKEMNKFHFEEYGNPGSLHAMGEKALEAVTFARKKLAKEINARAHEIVFTSGATESINLAFFGLARSKLGKKRKKIIVSSIEHSCVYEICDALKKEGFKIIEVGVDKSGKLNLDELKRKIDKKTLLVNVMHVNNETGVIEDIKEIGEICRDRGVLFHTDCAQSFGKLEIDVRKMNIDLLSVSSYKIGGPKGVGFLYVREGIELKPIIHGGGQERGLRGGTENVPGIVGFSKALELFKKTNTKEIIKLRNYLINKLSEINVKINSPGEGIPNILNVSFLGVKSENLIYWLSNKGVYVSTGSACDSKRKKDNRVLEKLGLDKERIESAVRITLDDKLSFRDLDHVIKSIESFVKK